VENRYAIPEITQFQKILQKFRVIWLVREVDIVELIMRKVSREELQFSERMSTKFILKLVSALKTSICMLQALWPTLLWMDRYSMAWHSSWVPLGSLQPFHATPSEQCRWNLNLPSLHRFTQDRWIKINYLDPAGACHICLTLEPDQQPCDPFFQCETENQDRAE